MKRMQLAGILGMSLLAVSTATAQQPQQQGPAGPSATESIRTLAKGTGVKVKLQDQISSQTNQPGDVIKATIDGNVKDASGAVLFPEGSQAEIEVVNTGAGLGLALKSVMAVGQKYRLKTTPDYTSQGAGAGADVSVSAGGNMGPAARDSAGAGISGGAGVSADAGANPPAGAGANAGTRNTWNIFKDQDNGLGVVSDIKEPPVGGDFVIPPGTTVKFEFEQPVTVTSG